VEVNEIYNVNFLVVKMRFLYVSSGDVFSRHELGFVAALNTLGNIDVIELKREEDGVERGLVGSDNGVWDVMFYYVPCRNIIRLTRCRTLIEKVVDLDRYYAIFATPRLPVFLAKSLSKSGQSVILRLWSIRAAKLRDNLRFGAYEDIVIFAPSIIANMIYVANSTYSIAVDYATYAFALRTYPMLRGRLLKLYPPYGFMPGDSKQENYSKVPEVVDRGDYVLGFTTLSKSGAYLKFEAKPHAVVLYQIARKANIDVVLAGSSLDDWRRVFPGLKPPPNLHFVGAGFGDSVLAKLYSKARLFIMPITNRNISNRLLEGLFYGKPIITTEVVKYIHPELIHSVHVFISTWDSIVDDAIMLLRNDNVLKKLERGAKEAYNRFFSTRLNAEVAKRIVGD
jgi:glycosyltransferase involved in cell wall biosynthesis